MADTIASVSAAEQSEHHTITLWETLDGVCESYAGQCEEEFLANGLPPAVATDRRMLGSACDSQLEFGVLLCTIRWLETSSAEALGFPSQFEMPAPAVATLPDAASKAAWAAVSESDINATRALLDYVWKVRMEDSNVLVSFATLCFSRPTSRTRRPH